MAKEAESNTESVVTVADLKKQLWVYTNQVMRCWRERIQVVSETPSMGTIEVRARLDGSGTSFPMDAVPCYDDRVVNMIHWYAATMILPLHLFFPELALQRDRMKEGMIFGARMFEMVYHPLQPVARHPEFIVWKPVEKFKEGKVPFEGKFYYNDESDEEGPVFTFRIVGAVVPKKKRELRMKQERMAELRTKEELIREMEEFPRAEASLCGADSMNEVRIGMMQSSEEGWQCDWLTNVWNALCVDPFQSGSGDHLGSGPLIHQCVQFLTQLFRRANDLLSESVRSELDLYAWKHSRLYLRYHKEEFLNLIHPGKGKIKLVKLSVESPFECRAWFQVLQHSRVCYTAEIVAAPIFRFTAKL